MRSDPSALNRRDFARTSFGSLSGLALAWLMRQESRGEEPDQNPKTERPDLEPVSYDLRPKPTHFQPCAQAMISLWMQGGPSHLDLFDCKPELNRLEGKPFPGKIKYDNAAQASSKVLGTPWKFHKHGQCGMELSELLPHLGKIVDEICLIRSMHTGVNNHGQSIRAMNCGNILAGQPTLGSWLCYGLGSENQDLPAYLSLVDPGQLPVLGVENWSQGFLPSIYQGTVIRPREPRILNLSPPAHLQGSRQRRLLDYLTHSNQAHLGRFPGNHELASRMASYELAARMQTAAKEALDLSQETQATKRMYGLEDSATADFGTRCLIARRLVERGVRFVQVFTQNQFWDHHNRIFKSLPAACKKIDQPSAALVRDLKQRGLLDSTVVQWGGEMGRLPVIQNDAGRDKVGRDHNTYGFSMWLAGGGIRGGVTHGSTDEFGHHAIEHQVNHFDYHATLFQLFGLHPEQVTYRQDAVRRIMANIERGQVVDSILG